MTREPAALHRREAFADRVDLHDVRAAGEKLRGDVLQFLARNERAFKKRAAPAGEKKEHRVVRREIFGERKRLARGGERVFVRHGVSRLAADNAGDCPLRMAVFRDDDAGIDPLAERRHRRRRHAPRRLSGGDEDHAPRKVRPVERAPDGFIRQHGFDRAGIDILRVLAQRTHEPITSFGSAFAKSIAPFSSFVNKSGRKNVR